MEQAILEIPNTPPEIKAAIELLVQFVVKNEQKIMAAMVRKAGQEAHPPAGVVLVAMGEEGLALFERIRELDRAK